MGGEGKKIFSHSFWMIGGGGMQAGIAFLSNMIFAWYLIPEDFGKYAILQANVNLSSAILNVRLEAILINNPSEKIKEKYNTYSSVAYLQGIVNLVFGIIFLTILDFWSYGAVLLIVERFLVFINIFQYGIYERTFNYKSIAYGESISKVVSHVVGMILVFITLNPIVLYLRSFLEAFLKLMFLIVIGEIQPMPFVRLKIENIKSLIKESKIYWLDFVLEASLERVLILFLGATLGEKFLGIFTQAKRLAVTPHQLLSPLAFRVSFNYFSKEANLLKNISVLFKIILFEFTVLLPICAVIYFFGVDIVTMFFGEKWYFSGVALQQMIGVVLFLTVFNTFKSFSMGNELLKEFIWIGRLGQYVMLIAAFSLILYIASNPVEKLQIACYGFSLVYIVPTILFMLFLYLKVNKAKSVLGN